MACVCLFSFCFCSVVRNTLHHMAINSFANIGGDLPSVRTESAQDMISETLSCGCVCSSYQLLPVTVQRQGFGSGWCSAANTWCQLLLRPSLPLCLPPSPPRSLPPSIHPPSPWLRSGLQLCTGSRLADLGLLSAGGVRLAVRTPSHGKLKRDGLVERCLRARDGRFLYLETKRLKRRIIIVKK